MTEGDNPQSEDPVFAVRDTAIVEGDTINADLNLIPEGERELREETEIPVTPVIGPEERGAVVVGPAAAPQAGGEEEVRQQEDVQEAEGGGRGLLERIWPLRRDREAREEYPRIEDDQMEVAIGNQEDDGRRERRTRVIAQTEIGQDVQEVIKKHSLISDAKYVQAIEKERKSRQEILNGFKNLAKNVAKVTIPLAGAYLGYHLVAGHSFESAISGIPDTAREVKDLFRKAKDAIFGVVGDLIGRGQEIERGFFDYNAVDPKQGGWFQRASLKMGALLDYIGIYNNPEKFSTGITKVIGTPFAAIFGKGSIFHKESLETGSFGPIMERREEKGYPNAGTWTKPVLAGLGVLTGAWAFHKAASILARKRDQWSAVGKLQRQEAKGLKAKEKSYKLLDQEEEAKETELAREHLDKRVQQIRERKTASEIRARAGIKENRN